MTHMTSFQFYKTAKGWRWRFKAGNTAVVTSGETYHSRDDCLMAIHQLKATTSGTATEEIDDPTPAPLKAGSTKKMR